MKKGLIFGIIISVILILIFICIVSLFICFNNGVDGPHSPCDNLGIQECCNNWAIENNVDKILCEGIWVIKNNSCIWACKIIEYNNCSALKKADEIQTCCNTWAIENQVDRIKCPGQWIIKSGNCNYICFKY